MSADRVTERVGQYYFEVIKQEFVNNGHMIEDKRSLLERWPLGKAWACIMLPIGSAYISMGIGLNLLEQVSSRTEIISRIGKESVALGAIGLISVCTVAGMSVTFMLVGGLYDRIEDRIKRNSPKPLFSS